MKKIVLPIFMVLCWSVETAADQVSAENLFPEARVMYAQQTVSAPYRLFLSAPKKINSQWVFERDYRLDGELNRKTLELATGDSFDEAKQKLQTYFKSTEARLLFSCTGLDCGSSNVWANEVFKVKQLYGVDALQLYQVWEISVEDQSYFITSYLSQRGNRRIYLQFDLLKASSTSVSSLASSPKTLLEDLLNTGYWVVPVNLQSLDNLDTLKTNEHIAAIATALQLKPLQKVVLVGHAYGETMDANLERSQLLADAALEALTALGVRSGQMSAKGIGSLAPQSHVQNRFEQVVLVLH